MIQQHWQLNGPDLHKGDQLDCVPCRAALLEAFKAPADVSEEDIIHAMDASRTPIPQDVLPGSAGPCTSCAHPAHSELACRPICGCTAGYIVQWRTFELGGHRARFAWEHASRPSLWTVRCSCGHSNGGHSAQPVSSEALAEAWAIKHVMEMNDQ